MRQDKNGGEVYLYVVTDAPTARGLGPNVPKFGVPFQIWRDNAYGEGAGSQRSTILGVSYAYTLYHRTAKCENLYSP